MSEENFTVAQLKATLKRLNLPTTGDKAALKKRLFDYDSSGAWKDVAKNVYVEDRQQASQEDESDYELPRAEAGQAYTTHENPGLSSTEKEIVSNLARDLERMRRENEIMQRRLEELGRERDRATERGLAFNAVFSTPSLTPRPIISALGELLNDFSGAKDIFKNWKRQLELIRVTYNLDDNNTRILIGMKLKRKASQWFHAKPEHLEMPVRELISEMEKMFDHRPSKMELRRRFEKRNFIIDGIPETHLRNQARMHRFGEKAELLEAFEQVTLRPENKNRPGKGNIVSKTENKQLSKPKDTEQRRESKCYNCNKTGHLAKNCDKPKRKKGSCFECGSMEHRAQNCDKKKTTSLDASLKEADN
ncbi:Gag-Pol polyprotein [Cyphomyrmex costatus]|uniref:Gag-Pol polyprotein n=1 Tax=Cyphomyrmex costatus TaxID=456900 RepID=A0A151IB27_9HYME|nr:Gag-Pol polyprotein [Cyphomyrmex costatus]